MTRRSFQTDQPKVSDLGRTGAVRHRELRNRNPEASFGEETHPRFSPHFEWLLVCAGDTHISARACRRSCYFAGILSCSWLMICFA